MGEVPHNMDESDLFAVVEQLQTGFALYDENLHLIFANKTIRHFLPRLYKNLDAGQSMPQCLASQVESTFPELTKEQRNQRVAQILNTIRTSGTMIVTTPEGRKLNSKYKKTHDGRYAIVTMDVTDRVHHAENLKHERRLAELANAEKSDFLANMSHEIRTPLTSIFSAMQIMQQRVRDGHLINLEELIEIAMSRTEHLNALVTDVLDLSKIEAGQIDLKTAEHCFRELLTAIVESQRTVAIEKGLKVVLAIDKNLPRKLFFDDVRITQCVTNLISNAIKFTTRGSVTVALQFDRDRHMIKLHVADTGIGIHPEKQSLVFEKYAQVTKDSNSSYGGTGLGLAISRKLARLMGGDITLVSEPEKGSIFTLTLIAAPKVSSVTTYDAAA